MYRVDDPRLIGRPENPSTFPLEYIFEVGGQELIVPSEPLQITADPAKGEIRRRMNIIPPVSLALGRAVQIFSPGVRQSVDVETRAYRDDLSGVLKLDVPTRLEGHTGVATVSACFSGRPCALHFHRHGTARTEHRSPERSCHHRQQDVRHQPPGNSLRTHPAATAPAARAGQSRVSGPRDSTASKSATFPVREIAWPRASPRWVTKSRRSPART